MDCFQGGITDQTPPSASAARDGDTCTSGWGLRTLPIAPAVLTRVLKDHACQRWKESTGGEWGACCPDSVRKRSVLPAEMPSSISQAVAAWLARLALLDGWTDSHRAVLSRSPAEHERDLESAGYGFAPPKTGDLGLHRDSEVTLPLLLPRCWVGLEGVGLGLIKSEYHTLARLGWLGGHLV
jgi:hypothetical protein